jgi:site-specific DNA recombinase
MRITRVYGEQKKKRVAAYCRVSTETAGQQESYDTQVRYYETLIPSNPDWEYIGVYADEGRSGTGVKNRPEFLRLMQDAADGKIDIILTKSISRFARNVVDCQRYVKDLKSKGVEVRFEREGISSMDAGADFIFSMLAMVAQEESRSISENVKWRYEKSFEKGVYHLGSGRILGYDMNEDGKLIPNEDAWIIQRIFESYASGMSLSEIADELNTNGAKRLRCDKPFDSSLIWRMLRNECYVGDRLLQKNPPRDFLTKRPDTSAEHKSYYIKDNHEGIIDRITWDAVKAKIEQDEADRAAGVYRNCTNTHFLYGKVFCSECGSPYTRRTFKNRQGESYKAWNCRERQRGNKRCKNSSIKEDVLLGAIAEALGLGELERELFEGLVEKVLVDGREVRVEVKGDVSL